MGGVSSRQTFTQAIAHLQSRDVDPNGHAFWDDLWKTTLTVDEIFELAPAGEIRKIMDKQPANLRTLFTQAVAQLYQVVETPYPVYFDQALNCAHILARILPFMVESKNPDILSICWGIAKKKKSLKAKAAKKVLPAPPVAKEDEGKNEEAAAAGSDRTNSVESDGGYRPPAIMESMSTSDSSGSKEKDGRKGDIKEEAGEGDKEEVNLSVSLEDDEEEERLSGDGGAGNIAASQEPAAVILINSLFHLLFLPDFTIEDPARDFREDDLNTPAFKAALMWAPGVGCNEKSVNVSTQFDKARIDVLRVMIACFSDALYQSPEGYDSCRSLWLEVATSADVPYAEIALYSLINTVLGYDPVGWGIPYGNMLATDTAKLLMETAVHALMILLDFGHPVKMAPQGPSQGQGDSDLPSVDAEDTRAQGFNVFRKILGSIEDPAQLQFMFRGFVRLLNNIPQSDASYVPFSASRVTVEQELLVLLWKCLEEVPKFMPYILRHCDVTELLQPICYFMLEGRKDPSKVGLMYLCTFTLLKLSGERNFGVALNKPHQLTIPVDVPLFSGTHADLLFICLHKLVVNGTEKLGALYNCFLTIICNVSPYCKSLSGTTSSKLLNLFSLFSSPPFLYGLPSNYVYVVMLLETFNNIVQYQYEGNANLVYAILRRKTLFESLANLALDRAIADARASRAGMPGGTEPQPSAVGAGNLRAAAASRSAGASASAAPARRGSAGGSADDLKKVSTPPEATKAVDLGAVERTGEVDVATKGASLISSPVRMRSDSTKAAGGAEGEGEGEGEAEPEQEKEGRDMQEQEQEQGHGEGEGQEEQYSDEPFEPTQAWLEEARREMPLSTILRLLRHLAPQVEELSSTGAARGTSGILTSGGVDEAQVLEFIRETTMVGLLPVPHPIVIRKYQPNRYTSLWFSAFMWGVIFMHNQRVPLFDGKAIRLFQVQNGR